MSDLAAANCGCDNDCRCENTCGCDNGCGCDNRCGCGSWPRMNNGSCGCSFIWILILLAIFGNGSCLGGCFGRDNGCGCGCGDNSCWIIILLLLFCGNGNGFGCC